MHPSNYNVVLLRLRQSAAGNRKALAARVKHPDDRASRCFSELYRLSQSYDDSAEWEPGSHVWKDIRQQAREILAKYGLSPATADALWYQRADGGRVWPEIRALIDTGVYHADGSIADADTDDLDI